jgi:hypothetical protein
MAVVLAGRPRAAVRAVAAALAVVLAVLLIGGCSSSGGQGGPGRSASTDTSLRQLLNRHAAAVLDRDRSAYLAGIDPEARRFLGEQRQVFANLVDVPLAAWSYTLVRTGAFPVPPAADGTRRIAAEVVLRYRLTGYDVQPVVSTAYVTFDERGGRWYLAADDDGVPSGHRTAVQLWDQGPVRVVRGAHSLVLGLAAEQVLKGYAADADEAVPKVMHAWGTSWPGRVVVEAPATLAEMGALLGAGADTYQGIAAVTLGEPGTDTAGASGRGAGGGAPADRVIVNPQAFGELSAFGRQVVLTHETTHVATRTATDSRTPLWLSEGTADWVAYRDTGRTAREIAPELAADVRAGRLPAALPSAADFQPGSASLAQAYEGGWLACRMIADQWSPQTLTSFYRAVARGGTLDARLRAAVGLDLTQFTARWRAYVEGELR